MRQMTLLEALHGALAHYQARRLGEAERICREILSVDPKCADAIGMLGLIAFSAGNSDVACELVRRAISLQPGHAKFRNDLGLILSAEGKVDDAITAFREAVAIRPDYAEAFNNLGTVLKRRMRLDEAIASYERATQLLPGFAEARYNLGNCLKERGRPDEAIASFRNALAVRPDFAEALCNLGTVLKDVGEHAEAVATQCRAEKLKPDAGIASTYLCTLQFDPAQSLTHILAEHARWDRTYAQPLAASAAPHANDPAPGRKLRIGYVSPDLCLHPVAYCLMPVFQNHDRQRHQVFCYNDVEHADAMTAQFRLHVDVWRNTQGLRDAQLSELIRQDQIDVLIDLAGHSNGNRLMAFARRPAPVQINWLGWPGTTGMSAMDYRISDRYIDSPDAHFTEKTLYLPDCFWCFDPMVVEAEPNDLPALAARRITFGCTNNFGKITGTTLDLWGAVMNAVPDSTLLLRAPSEGARQRVLDRLSANGVKRERVEFAGKLPRQDYWKFYHRIDINLDAAPYNGHVTTMDSLYMGVPMVSLAGGMPLARAGYSILSNVGLGDFVAHEPERYVQIAAAAANDLPRLSSLRATLRDWMKKSAMMNAPEFTRNIEGLYRQAWKRWCGNQ